MTQDTAATPAPRLRALTSTFALIGLTSLGGATFSYFYSEFVDRRKWLSHEELMDYRALSQLLPGANMGNLAILVGRRLGGLSGAVSALAAMIAPGAVLMLLLSLAYFHSGNIPTVTSLLKGIGPAAAGLTLGNALQASRREVRRLRSVWLLPATVAMMLLLRPSTLVTIAVLGAIGVALYRPKSEPQVPQDKAGDPA